MKLIVDKEINLNITDLQGEKNDLLNTKHYADILLQSIKDAPAKEPYTIGLFGEWGCGKSSVIKTMIEDITNVSELKKVKVVSYDAWKYSGDSFRRMFLYELRNALNYGESSLMQSFYVNETDEAEIKSHISWKKVMLVVVFIILAIFVVCLIKRLLGIGFAIPSTIALVALLFSLYSFVFDQLKVSIQKPLLFAPEQFEDCYKEIITCTINRDIRKEKSLKWITLGLSKEKLRRIVIIIDNIDRCQPDIAYTLLTDIKNFLCKEFNVIFVIPVDIDALRKHIIKTPTERYNIQADEFLRKFFNASIWIKPFQNDEIYDFAYSIAKKNNLDFKPDTISLVANEFASNPRRIIQLYNNLQIELLCFAPEFSAEHQALICKMLIIREEFPNFYRMLLLNPSLFFIDVEQVKESKTNQLDVNEKIIINDERLCSFLHATAGISNQYLRNEEVVNSILVNSQIQSKIPENIRQAYKKADAKSIVEYAKEENNRVLLVDYLQDNIKKMSNRHTISSVGRMHIDVLLILFEHNLLTTEDKRRLISPLYSINSLSNCVDLYNNKQALIKFGKDLETIRLPKLTETIGVYFKNIFGIAETLSEDDTNNVFYAASIWDKADCSHLEILFPQAIQRNPIGVRKYEYSVEKHKILFTKDVFDYIYLNLNPDNCTDEKSVFQSFRYLCRIKAVKTEQLIDFINKASEKAPVFSRNQSDDTIILAYLKTLSDIFAEVRYLGRIVPQSVMTQLFDKVNGAKNVIENINYRNQNVFHSFVKDRASDEQFVDTIISFFINCNLVTDGPVINNEEIERLMNVEQNRDKVLDSIVFLKNQGVDVSTWTNAVIKYPRRIDKRRIDILMSVFVQKNKEWAYVVKEDVVQREMNELINIIQSKQEGYEMIVDIFDTILNDERIDKIVRDILSQKSLDEQKNLPHSLMTRAISSFEQNVNKLTIPNDINILQLIASNGSESGEEGVWGIINPILADGKNQNQETINAALQVLTSFSKMTKEHADALSGNVKALPTSKITSDHKSEILAFIKKFQS